MKRINLIVLLLLNVIGSNEKAYANTNNPPRPFEEIFPEVGYKSVDEAIKEFEDYFKQDLKLPLRTPPHYIYTSVRKV
ncbi:hypothetical protein [Heyndrickxia oleronia]|uniref:hypothetical protein n=1 Tax=Heyndrickxia oleronia TaxID=38875 RepID=UPI001B1D332F|nr:hypothetical protein [Heyndrickxia oleronia]GIN39281.1 hypothetical protein J19TS1_22300 [Heyndrickxia oleronia]